MTQEQAAEKSLFFFDMVNRHLMYSVNFAPGNLKLIEDKLAGFDSCVKGVEFCGDDERWRD